MDDRPAEVGWFRWCETGQCVEIRRVTQAVQMRSEPSGDELEFSRAAFADFLAAVKRGEFDLP